MYVRILAKSSYYLCHVCPSVRQHLPLRVPLDAFSWNSKYGQNRTKLSGTLHEDLSKPYCCRRQSVATKTLMAANGGGEGEDGSIHVTSQRRLCDNCEHRSLRDTNPVLYNGQSVVRTSITGDRVKLHLTRFYSNSGQGIIECIGSSAHVPQR